jgi:hypothetical protein
MVVVAHLAYLFTPADCPTFIYSHNPRGSQDMFVLHPSSIRTPAVKPGVLFAHCWWRNHMVAQLSRKALRDALPLLCQRNYERYIHMMFIRWHPQA